MFAYPAIQRPNLLTEPVCRTESGHIAEKRIWPFSFFFCSGETSTLKTLFAGTIFAPPQAKEKEGFQAGQQEHYVGRYVVLDGNCYNFFFI